MRSITALDRLALPFCVLKGVTSYADLLMTCLAPAPRRDDQGDAPKGRDSQRARLRAPEKDRASESTDAAVQAGASRRSPHHSVFEGVEILRTDGSPSA